RFRCDPVRRPLAGGAICHAKAASVIPHCPSNSISLKRSAKVSQPAGAILRIGSPAIYAELVACQGHVPMLCPIGSLADFYGHAGCVPVIEAVTKDHQPV